MGRARNTDTTRHAMGPTTWARVPAAFLEVARGAGLPVAQIRERVGLSPEALRDPDGRVSLESLYDLVEECARQSRDPLVHMRMTTQLSIESLDVLGFLFMTSPTLGDALHASMRFQRVWCEGERYELEEHDPWLRIVYVPWGPPRVAHALMAEMFAVDMLVNGSRVVGQPIEAQVHFAHGSPSDPDAHAALLGVRAEFSAARNEVWLDRGALATPIAQPGHEAMFAFFERTLEEKLRALGSDTASARVMGMLLASADLDLDLAVLAQRLHMSPRTLQRRLADEGTSLRALVDQARRARAITLLEGGSSIAEVAYFLGYSEASAFHRAFRRWTGRTPESYRREHTGSHP